MGIQLELPVPNPVVGLSQMYQIRKCPMEHRTFNTRGYTLEGTDLSAETASRSSFVSVPSTSSHSPVRPAIPIPPPGSAALLAACLGVHTNRTVLPHWTPQHGLQGVVCLIWDSAGRFFPRSVTCATPMHRIQHQSVQRTSHTDFQLLFLR